MWDPSMDSEPSLPARSIFLMIKGQRIFFIYFDWQLRKHPMKNFPTGPMPLVMRAIMTALLLQ